MATATSGHRIGARNASHRARQPGQGYQILAAQAGETDNIQPSTSTNDSTVIDLAAYGGAQKRT